MSTLGAVRGMLIVAVMTQVSALIDSPALYKVWLPTASAGGLLLQ